MSKNFAIYENLQALFTAIGKKKLSVSDTMPTAGAAYEDICILYIGPTDANYTKGYVYECEEVTPATDPKTYEWNAKINVDVDLSKYKTIFPGTKEEWEALTEAQQDQYDYCFFDGDESDYYAVSDEVTEGDMHPVTSNAVADIIKTKADKVSNATNGDFAGLDANGNLTDSGKKPSDFQTVLTFDNAPTENSNNPVKSGGVYSANQNIYEVMGAMGAKNILRFPYTATSHSILTVNDDGSLTLNGTPTSDFWVAICNSSENVDPFILPAGKYIFSCARDSASVPITLGVRTVVGDTSLVSMYFGNENYIEAEFELSEPTNVKVRGFIGANTAVNGTIYPMIRLADNPDTTYQPYAKTNQQLTEDKAEQAEVNDIVNDLGAKNIAQIELNAETLYGIAFSSVDNAMIKMNGTASESNIKSSVWKSHLKAGKYIASIDVISGSHTEAKTIWFEKNRGTTGINPDITITTETHKEREFTVETEGDYHIQIGFQTGDTFNNLIVAYMIRPASIENGTFEPYTKTNRQLTETTNSITPMLNVLGAKNIFDIEKWLTAVGLAYTKNGDVYTTTTGGTSYGSPFSFADKDIDIVISGIITNDTSDYVRVEVLNVNNEVVATIKEDTTFASGKGCKVRLNWSVGGNFTIEKPMIHLATIEDSTYAPYAKTNRELTDWGIPKRWTAELYDYDTWLMSDNSERSVYFRIGKFGIAFFRFTLPNSEITISTMLQIRNIPFGKVYGGNIFVPPSVSAAHGGDRTVQYTLLSDGDGKCYFRPNMIGTYGPNSVQEISGTIIGFFN